MKHNWEYKRLGDVCTVIGGSTPRTDNPEYWDGDFNWFTPAELDDRKYYSESTRKITSEAVKAAGLTLLPIGTVLLSSRAPIGKIGITTQESYCNQGFKNLICKEGLYNEYLYYVLTFFKDEIISKGKGSTFKEISKSATEKIEIPVPPMDEQERIVAELDKINEMIAVKREQLCQLNLLAQSLFYDTFGDPIINPKGWETKKLGEMCITIQSGPFGTVLHESDYVESDGIPLVNPQNIVNGKIQSCKQKLVNPNKLIDLQRYILKTEDVVIARRGDLKKCTIISQDQQGWLCGTGSCLVRLKDINPMFFYFWFTSNSVQSILNENIIGSTMPNLNQNKLKDIDIFVLPHAIQQQFAAQIEAIEAQKTVLNDSLKELQTLLDSRMDYWFN